MNIHLASYSTRVLAKNQTKGTLDAGIYMIYKKVYEVIKIYINLMAYQGYY